MSREPEVRVDTELSGAEQFGNALTKAMSEMCMAIESGGRLIYLKNKPTLTTDEVEELYGLNANTLRKKRSYGKGPDYIQDGDGAIVMYRHEDIQAWILKNKRKGA